MDKQLSKNEKTPGSGDEKRGKYLFLPALLQFLLCIIILGAGFAIASYYLRSAPQAKPRKREPSPLTVQVEKARYEPHQLVIEAMGTIIPSREISLTSSVSGEIVQMSPDLDPGGFVKKGAHLLSVDPRDYEFTVQQRTSDVNIAESDLALEMGNQLIALKEFEILGEKTTPHEKQLMLRQPHLEHKKATLKGARTKLDQAELNLARTRTKAPFNAVILSRKVNIGSHVSIATPLAQLAGTDEFWLKLTGKDGSTLCVHQRSPLQTCRKRPQPEASHWLLCESGNRGNQA
ncbi:MAG: hypothetical protein JRJ68_06745 [Deltaproteobacteria bacterium]|nr:hypothetical protein [Deltaproteobacteria bacterium]